MHAWHSEQRHPTADRQAHHDQGRGRQTPVGLTRWGGGRRRRRRRPRRPWRPWRAWRRLAAAARALAAAAADAGQAAGAGERQAALIRQRARRVVRQAVVGQEAGRDVPWRTPGMSSGPGLTLTRILACTQRGAVHASARASGHTAVDARPGMQAAGTARTQGDAQAAKVACAERDVDVGRAAVVGQRPGLGAGAAERGGGPGQRGGGCAPSEAVGGCICHASSGVCGARVADCRRHIHGG